MPLNIYNCSYFMIYLEHNYISNVRTMLCLYINDYVLDK